MEKIKKIFKIFFWRIRKKFNLPNKEEKELLQGTLVQLHAVAKQDDRAYSSEQNHREQEHNGTCPHCGNSDRTDIVNRIGRVQGKGSVHGDFRLGYGSVYGSSSTDTSEINHCNKCGNEWKKYEYKTKWEKDFLGKYLNDIANHKDEDETWRSYKKTVERLNERGMYAETFKLLMKTTSFYKELYYDTEKKLTLDYLRSKFTSVYDSTEPK